MEKQNVFELLNFIKRRLQRDQENYSITKPNNLPISSKTSNKNAPNLIMPLGSKIHMSKRKTRNSVNQPGIIAQTCSKQNFKEPKMTLLKLQQDIVK